MEGGEKGTGPGAGSSEEKEKNQDCGWKNCQKHVVKPEYPGGGNITKRGYKKKWENAGMLPWVLGTGSPRLDAKGKLLSKEYDTQAHHLVPRTLLTKTSTLKDNLILAKYDCDELYNGFILPCLPDDMPCHDLPQHRGYHPGGYMDPIREQLNELDDEYKKACHGKEGAEANKAQLAIVKELQLLAQEAQAKITNIRTGKDFWPLRSDSLAAYQAMKVEYARRKKLYEENA